ncbi:MAG: transcription elongation factor GreA [Chloroflexota bacterium]
MPDRGVYLTRDGFARFEQELEHLRTVKRMEVSERLRKAKDGADTIDNAEYDEAKSEQSFVEGRIQELEGLLAAAKIIGEGPHPDVVALGSVVVVRDDDNEEERYTIVGSVEADPRHGLISNESPMGRALIGKRKGEQASVDAPGGSFTLTVMEVS